MRSVQRSDGKNRKIFNITQLWLYVQQKLHNKLEKR